jgi:hypothetical protein
MTLRRRASHCRRCFSKRHLIIKVMSELSIYKQIYAQIYHKYKIAGSKKAERIKRAKSGFYSLSPLRLFLAPSSIPSRYTAARIPGLALPRLCGNAASLKTVLKASEPQVSNKGIRKTNSACRQKSVPCLYAPLNRGTPSITA